jgi:GTP-dependent phosphoenolpyruvate carboxykinase
MSKMLKFDKLLKKATDEEIKVIRQIVRRAKKDYAKHDIEIDLISTEMDLVAVHKGCCKLDLEKLLKFDDFNFSHDISGISRYLDRNNIKLKDCFVPRCAR